MESQRVGSLDFFHVSQTTSQSHFQSLSSSLSQSHQISPSNHILCPSFQTSSSPQLGIPNRLSKALPLTDEHNEAQQLHFATQNTTTPGTINHAQRLPRWCVSEKLSPLFHAVSTIGHLSGFLRRTLPFPPVIGIFLLLLLLPCWHELLLYSRLISRLFVRIYISNRRIVRR